MWMTSHGQCLSRGGGGACECPRGGVVFNFLEGGWRHTDNVQGGVPVNVQEWGRFSNWWRHADNVQGGGVRLVFHPSSSDPPPPPPGWLATGLPYNFLSCSGCYWKESFWFYWGLTPQQQPGSYQGGEMMMMKSVFWWKKPEYPEETTDLRQVTDETKYLFAEQNCKLICRAYCSLPLIISWAGANRRGGGGRCSSGYTKSIPVNIWKFPWGRKCAFHHKYMKITFVRA